MENYKLPKNIRQIGGREERIRVYLEDYVNTYIHRFPVKTDNSVSGGVLLGEQMRLNGASHLFIRGAIAVDDPLWKKEHGQEGLKEKIRLYFPDLEVCGWFVCDNEGTVQDLQLIKIFEEHFREDNQILFHLQGTDEDFYARDSEEGLRKLEGYYIYYERNDQMQEYMISEQPAGREGAGEKYKTDMAREPAENAAKKILEARRTGAGPRSRKTIVRRKLHRRKRQSNSLQKSKTKQASQQVAAAKSPQKKKSEGSITMADILIRAASLAGVFLLAFFIFTNQTKLKGSSNSETQQAEQVNLVQADQISATDLTDMTDLTDEVNAMIDEKGNDELESDELESNELESDGFGNGILESDETDDEELGTDTGQASALVGGNGNSNAYDIEDSTAESTSEISSEADSESSSESGAESSSVNESTSQSESAAASANSNVPSSYTVLKGESLASISQKFYGTDSMVDKICKLNGINNSDYIQVGEVLKMP